MKKFLFGFIGSVVLVIVAYFCIIYFVTFSNGFRSGQLVKVSYKGLVFKTWEGEISQGVSESQIFKFSIQEGEKEVIEDLKNLQGKVVKLTYKERFSTFPWLGDTKYFITEVEEVGGAQFQY